MSREIEPAAAVWDFLKTQRHSGSVPSVDLPRAPAPQVIQTTLGDESAVVPDTKTETDGPARPPHWSFIVAGILFIAVIFRTIQVPQEQTKRPIEGVMGSTTGLPIDSPDVAIVEAKKNEPFPDSTHSQWVADESGGESVGRMDPPALISQTKGEGSKSQAPSDALASP